MIILLIFNQVMICGFPVFLHLEWKLRMLIVNKTKIPMFSFLLLFLKMFRLQLSLSRRAQVEAVLWVIIITCTCNQSKTSLFYVGRLFILLTWIHVLWYFVVYCSNVYYILVLCTVLWNNLFCILTIITVYLVYTFFISYYWYIIFSMF